MGSLASISSCVMRGCPIQSALGRGGFFGGRAQSYGDEELKVFFFFPFWWKNGEENRREMIMGNISLTHPRWSGSMWRNNSCKGEVSRAGIKCKKREEEKRYKGQVRFSPSKKVNATSPPLPALIRLFLVSLHYSPSSFGTTDVIYHYHPSHVYTLHPTALGKSDSCEGGGSCGFL